ncbi:MAG: hypothetical protein PUD53_08780 [Oscillospiraceae bacterium]|nr:hypothetical protein [Oscillospiraceae bacterium]
MKKQMAILMSVLVMAGSTVSVNGVTNGSVVAKTSATHSVIKSHTSRNSARKKANKLNVKSAIKTARNYGTKLGMHHDKTLNTDNASWFAPTNTKYYKNTTELKKALKGDVRYVAYFYKDSEIVPSDITFNIVKENSKIYVVYC